MRVKKAALAALFVTGCFVAGGAPAQVIEVKARIWEQGIGVPISDLPARYLDPHCGTNGGPPSFRLSGWADYRTCPIEPETGLREIWFTEDDEAEYVARAYRGQIFEPGPAAANVWLNHKVIYSLLIDEAGLVQGYRVITDPREPESYRYNAQLVGNYLLALYGFNVFTCTDLEPEPGETDVDGEFVKQDCVGVSEGRHISIQRRFLRKPGQTAVDPLTQQATVNYFESLTRLEVVAAHLVTR